VEYDRLIAEYLVAGRNAMLVNRSGRVLMGQLLAAFLAHAEEHYTKNDKPTSEVNAYEQVIRSIRKLYRSVPVDSFGPLSLKAVRQTWIDAGIVRTKVNQRQQRVVRIFKWGVAEELVRPETWQALRSVEGLKKGRTTAPESPPIMPVSIDTIQATIPHLSPVVADMIRMQLLTGMRPGEVCKLRPCDIDRSNEVWEYRPESHKTEHHGRDRVVFIGPQAKSVLSPYLFREPIFHCFSPAESREWFRDERAKSRTTPESCGNARGRRGKRGLKAPKQKKNPLRSPRTYFDTPSYDNAIRRGCRKAWPAPEAIADNAAVVKAWHLEHHWSPNQIRHTRATEIRKEFGLEAAQIILGHASADVTQIYAERDAEKARDVIRQIG
jgi:integrase